MSRNVSGTPFNHSLEPSEVIQSATQLAVTTAYPANALPVMRDRGRVAAPASTWMALDWALALYVTYVGFVAVGWAVPYWPYVLGGHAALVVTLLLLPPRGAAWEQSRPSDSRWLSSARSVARFLRYTYPALLLTPFFEEVSLTVNAAAAGAPYWFEHYLVNADRTLFGGTPAVMLSQAGHPVLDEIMHAFYFSYYPLIIGGIVIAWNAGRRGRGFHTAMTCMMLGFFLSYVWYPFLPARGPWEHPELMADLRPFGGWVFTRAINLIMAGAAVSGGCFPSAHVSGTWALTFGLYATDRKAALWWGLLAAGLSVACVYTRYHHGVDVVAGLMVAGVAATIGYRLTRNSPPVS
jgi:membrane-associated phospholipid phosphatase